RYCGRLRAALDRRGASGTDRRAPSGAESAFRALRDAGAVPGQPAAAGAAEGVNVSLERSRLRVMAWSAGDYGPSRFACNGEVGPRCATKQLDGQISKNPSSPFRENIPLNPSGKSALRLAHPVPREGRIAIVTDVGTGCGGRGSVGRERDRRAACP